MAIIISFIQCYIMSIDLIWVILYCCEIKKKFLLVDL